MPLTGTIPTPSLTRPTASVSLMGTKYRVLIILTSFPPNLNCPRTSNDHTYLHSYSYSSHLPRHPQVSPGTKHPRPLQASPDRPKHPPDTSLQALLPPCIDLVKYQDLYLKASNSVFRVSPVFSLYDNFWYYSFIKQVGLELVSKYQDK